MLKYIVEHPLTTIVLPIVAIVMFFMVREIKLQDKHNHLHDEHNRHNPNYHTHPPEVL